MECPSAPHYFYPASPLRFFTKFTIHLVHPAPIGWIIPACNRAPKRRKSPILGVADQPMLDRVEVDITNMTHEISLTPYRAFPKPALPRTAFTLGHPRGGSALTFRSSSRDTALDQSPPRRKITIAVRQYPHRMQMLRQHDPCVDHEWLQRAAS